MTSQSTMTALLSKGVRARKIKKIGKEKTNQNYGIQKTKERNIRSNELTQVVR